MGENFGGKDMIDFIYLTPDEDEKMDYDDWYADYGERRDEI